jgi:GNAT superfamily N-acetyltransferase
MGRRIVDITAEVLDDLPDPCRGCAFWEGGPGNHDGVRHNGHCDGDLNGGLAAEIAQEAVKESWVRSTTTAWGPCGRLVYVDDVPAGFLMYAPPAYVPRAAAFPTSPIASDAVLLMTARVVPPYVGQGLGRVLFQSAAKELTRRGVRAIEAYGSRQEGCVLPVGFLESVGFATVRDHVRHPRMRVDLRTAVSWKDPVGGAWERFRGTVRPFPAGANRT